MVAVNANNRPHSTDRRDFLIVSPSREINHRLSDPEYYFRDRVCFGTDAPFQRPHVVRAWYDAMLKYDVTEAETAMVMGGNIARLLGL